MPPAVLAMKTGAPDGAIDEDAEVEFALDVQAFFDQQAADDAAFFAGLRRDELHAENLPGERLRLRRGDVASFTPPRFAAAAGVNLRFHHDDRSAQALRPRRALRPF